MHKLAFFVEGQTEKIFLQALLKHFFEGKDLVLKSIDNFGKRATLDVESSPGCRIFILIVNTGEDRHVVSKIRKNAKSLLIDHNYSKIIGLRDVYSQKCRTLKDKDNIINGISNTISNLRQKNNFHENELSVILSIMEIEA